jgi:peroxiredoxin
MPDSVGVLEPDEHDRANDVAQTLPQPPTPAGAFGAASHPAACSGSRAGRFRVGRRRESAACSSAWGCRWPMYLAMAILILTPFILGGCSAASSATGAGSVAADSNTQGFVAGDGSLTLLDPQDRKPAPEVAGTTLAGTEFSTRDHLGEVVVLNVWASWCAPCRSEAPALTSVWKDTKAQDVQFVGLVTRDSPASAQAFADRFNLGYPHLLDDDGSLQLLFHDSLPPQAIPSTLVLDKQGRVAGRAIGEVSESSLRGFIEPLLSEDQAG